MDALPGRGVVDMHLLHDTHSTVMNGRNDEIQHSVTVHDGCPVAVGLFLVSLLSLDGSVFVQKECEILDRREIGGGKQGVVHRYLDMISFDL